MLFFRIFAVGLFFFSFSLSADKGDYSYVWETETKGVLHIFDTKKEKENGQWPILFSLEIEDDFYQLLEKDAEGHIIREEKFLVKKNSPFYVLENFTRLLFGEKVIKKELLQKLKKWGLLEKDLHGSRKPFHKSFRTEFFHHIAVDRRIFRVIRYGTLISYGESIKGQGWKTHNPGGENQPFLDSLDDKVEDYILRILPVRRPKKIQIFTLCPRFQDYWRKEMIEEVKGVEVEETIAH